MNTTAARERPLILTPEETRAVLAGAKTQTRRIIHFDPHSTAHQADLTGATPHVEGVWPYVRLPDGQEFGPLRSPVGLPGERVWVREAWRANPVLSFTGDSHVLLKYRADNATRKHYGDYSLKPHTQEWRSPILMPRWAARLLLEITDVRIARLQGLTNEEAQAEGVRVTRLPLAGADGSEVAHFGDWPTPLAGATARDAYAAAWDAKRTHPKQKWEANPWVWAITFKRVEETPA